MEIPGLVVVEAEPETKRELVGPGELGQAASDFLYDEPERWPSGQQRSSKPLVSYDGSTVVKRGHVGKGLASNRCSKDQEEKANRFKEMPWDRVVLSLYGPDKKPRPKSKSWEE